VALAGRYTPDRVVVLEAVLYHNSGRTCRLALVAGIEDRLSSSFALEVEEELG